MGSRNWTRVLGLVTHRAISPGQLSHSNTVPSIMVFMYGDYSEQDIFLFLPGVTSHEQRSPFFLGCCKNVKSRLRDLKRGILLLIKTYHWKFKKAKKKKANLSCHCIPRILRDVLVRTLLTQCPSYRFAVWLSRRLTDFSRARHSCVLPWGDVV